MLTAEEAAKLYPGKPPYSPYAGRDFPTRPFFGDTHLHTSSRWMPVPSALGSTRATPTASRAASRSRRRAASPSSSRGRSTSSSSPITRTTWVSSRICLRASPSMLADPTGRKWYDMIQSGKGAEAAIEIIVAFSQGTFPKDIMYFPGTTRLRDAWQETIDAAEEYNEPGRFTAFIGYEWTSNTGGNNLHRNVIFRDNGDKASQVEPFTVYPPFGSDNPEELWKWMDGLRREDRRQRAGDRAQRQSEQRLDVPRRRGLRQDARPRTMSRRGRNGSGSTRRRRPRATAKRIPFLSPNDEFADFERWDKGNLDGSVAKKKEMLEFEYARSALKNGLKLEAEARHQSLQVRPDRQQRRAHRPRGDGGGQLLRQDHAAGTESAPHDRDLRR